MSRIKNSLTDLNNLLFEQIERLNDEDLTEDQLNMELRRAEGMSKIAGQIIQTGDLAYRTMSTMAEYGLLDKRESVPEMLLSRSES